MASQVRPGGATSGSSSTIFQQIEGTADYYPPATYAQLLSFYDDFVLGSDPAQGQFIPLTTTSTTWGEQSILFAVGIIPPAAAVTGKLLDRTASVATTEGLGDANISTGGTNSFTSGNIRDRIVAIANEYSGTTVAKDPDKFLGLLAGPNDGEISKFFLDPNISTCGLTIRGIWRTAGLEDPKLIQKYKNAHAISDLTDIGKANGAFHTGNDIKKGNYQIQPGDAVLVQKHDDPTSQHVYTVTGVDANGKVTSVDGGQTFQGQQGIGGNNRSIGVNSDGTLVDSVSGLNTLGGVVSATRDIVGVVDVSKLPFPPGTGAPTTNAVPGDVAGGPTWQGSGSANAQTAGQEQSQLAGSPLLSSATGQSFTSQQQAIIKATQDALNNMATCPPLAMMVNPASFSVKGEKIVTDGNWGRNGPIIEFWGDQQDKISASGKVAGFFAMDTQNAGGPGITRWARNFSAAWQNFQGLFQLYRSNGALFLSDSTTQGYFQTLSMLGSIYIYYDTVLYIGSFDSFNITESDSSPHTVEYSFEFTIRATFLLDRTDSAFDYGVQQIPVGSSIPFTTSPPVSQVITTQPVAPPYNPLTDNPTAPGANPSLTNAQGQTLQQQIASRLQGSR